MKFPVGLGDDNKVG
jgi:hypothetical protein